MAATAAPIGDRSPADGGSGVGGSSLVTISGGSGIVTGGVKSSSGRVATTATRGSTTFNSPRIVSAGLEVSEIVNKSQTGTDFDKGTGTLSEKDAVVALASWTAVPASSRPGTVSRGLGYATGSQICRTVRSATGGRGGPSC